MKTLMPITISIVLLATATVISLSVDTKQNNEIDDLKESVSELRWDYLSHKKIEECVGLNGRMDYEGANMCYAKEIIYKWNNEVSHWQVYKEDNFESYEIFRMKLND